MSELKKPAFPCFFVVEGIDGAGKTLISDHIYKRLTEAGYKVCRTREPGGTPFSEAIRGIFKGKLGETEDNITHALLMNASRRSHVQKVIRPALERGEIVLCDRYVQTTLAFQGDSPEVMAACDLGMDGMCPTATVLVECHPAVAVERLKQSNGRDSDWLDNSGEEVFKKRLNGYSKTARSYYHFGMPLLVMNNINNVELLHGQIDTLVKGTLLAYAEGKKSALFQTVPFLIEVERTMDLLTPDDPVYSHKAKICIELDNGDDFSSTVIRQSVNLTGITGIVGNDTLPFLHGLVVWLNLYSEPKSCLGGTNRYADFYRACVGLNKEAKITIENPDPMNYFQWLSRQRNVVPISYEHIVSAHEVDGSRPIGFTRFNMVFATHKTYLAQSMDLNCKVMIKHLGEERYYLAYGAMDPQLKSICDDNTVHELWIGNAGDTKEEWVQNDAYTSDEECIMVPDLKWALDADLEKQSLGSRARKLAIIFGDHLSPSRYIKENAQLRKLEPISEQIKKGRGL